MRPPVQVGDDAMMGIVEAQLKLADVRHVLVVDGAGKLVGIVGRGDVLRAEERGGHQFVRERMTRRLYTVRPEDPVEKAIDIMLERAVGAVPVVDAQGRPVGIVGEVDFLRRARATFAPAG